MRACLGSAFVVVVGIGATSAWAAVATFSSTLDDDASVTSSGGAFVNAGNKTYVAGAIGNAMQSTSSSTNAGGWARWTDATVGTIFNTWDNTKGITVDLYFRGSAFSGTSGSEGFWSMVRRNSGDSIGDTYFITQVNNGKLRILFANDSANQFKYTFDGATAGEIATNAPLSNNVTYHLTVRVKNGAFDAYLDDVGGNTYANSTPIFSASNLPVGYNWTLPLAGAVSQSGAQTGRQTREMDIGIRGFGNTANTVNNFGGTMKTGTWVDNVNVYNDFLSAADLVPEPTTALLLLGTLPILRRRRRHESA